MKKLNKKHVVFSLSAVMVTTAGMMLYPSSGEANNSTNKENIHLQVDKLDKDTLELSLTNIQDLPKSLQFTLKLGEGDVTFGENAMKWSELLTQSSSSIQTHITFDQSKKEAEFLIVSTEALPQDGGTLSLGQIDILSKDNKAVAYTLTNKESDQGVGYKYVVASTNELISESAFSVADEGRLTYNTAPILELATLDIIQDGKVVWPQGQALSAEKKLEFVVASDAEDTNITDIKVEGTVKTDTVGSYTLSYTVTDSLGEQATLTVPVVVEATLKEPVITGVSDEKTIRLGDIFNVLAGVSATDTYGNQLEIKVTGNENLFDDKHQALQIGEHTITYTVTDSYSQTATAEMNLIVKAPNPTWDNAQETLEVQAGEKVELSAISAKDYLGTDLTDRVTILGDYNTGVNEEGYAVKPGKYTVEYRVKDDYDNEIRHKMTLVVTGELTQPVINGIQPTLVAYVGDEVNVLNGITAVDHFKKSIEVTASGDYIDALEGNKATTAGEYNITYTTKDKYGNHASATAKLVVKSKTPTLTGVQEKLEVQAGSKVNPLEGITATDYLGNSIDKIELSGTYVDGVDEGYAVKAGTYEIVYKVEDSQGNQVEAKTSLVIEGDLNKPVFDALQDQIVVRVGDKVTHPTAKDHFNRPLEVEVSGSYGDALKNNIAMKAGEFEIQYTAIDKYGNSNTANTTLIIEEYLSTEEYFIPTAIESLIKKDLFKPIEGNATEGLPLYLEVQSPTTTEDVRQLLEAFQSKYEVIVKASNSRTMTKYVLKLVDKVDKTTTFYITLAVDTQNEEMVAYLEGLIDNSSTEDDTNKPGTVTPQVPENIAGVIKEDLFKPVEGNGSKESPLVLQIQKQTVVSDVKELVESFKEKYVVEIKKVMTRNSVIQYLMTLTNDTEKLYLNLEVDSQNVELVNYLDELNGARPGDNENSGNGSNTGSGDNENSGNGSNTGSGDNENSGSGNNTGLGEQNNSVTNEQESNGNTSEYSSAEKPNTGVNKPIPSIIAGIVAIGSGIGLAIKKRKK